MLGARSLCACSAARRAACVQAVAPACLPGLLSRHARTRTRPPRAEQAPALSPEEQAKAQALAAALSTPEAKQQMAEMQSFLGAPGMKEKLQALKDDPELADFFGALRTKGPAALAEFMDNDEVLRTISRKLGGSPGAAQPRPPAAPPPSPPAEITNLLEAARWSDLEAVDDFLSIGKPANTCDEFQRTPLHFAVAFGIGNDGVRVVSLLLDAGASIEAKDTKDNTPLAYAAGYGRPEFVSMLLDRGASTSARNANGLTPVELVKKAPTNPINADAALMERLGKGIPLFKDQQ